MKKAICGFIVGIVISSTSFAFAEVTGGTGGVSGGTTSGTPTSINVQFKNPIKYNTFNEFAAAVTETAVRILMPFLVLYYIYAGFLFIKAQGNKTELENAKKAIWYSIIGTFILFGAWGFAQIIETTIQTITN